MAIPILGDVIREVGGVVRELIPDADKRLEIQVRLAELADRADQREADLLLAQTQVNLQESKSANLFVAGWRPAIGWVSAGSLGWTWVAAPLVNWMASLLGHTVDLPALDPNAMYPVILAMLGISVSRTVEKVGGVATSMNGRVLANERPQGSQPSLEQPQTTPLEKLKSSTSRWFK